MIKIKYYYLYTILGLVSMFSLSSCFGSFLDTESITTATTENFYRTIDDAERALIGCYDGWQLTNSNGNLSFYVASVIMSDECFGGTGNTDSRSYQVLDRFDLSQSPSDGNLFNGTWTDYYTGIFRCNMLLQKLDQIAWGDNTYARNRIEGETKALRSILYFDMIRLFGNIPLLTEPTSDNIPQADPKEVYKLIVEDLLFASQNIPSDAYPKNNSIKNDGRITQYAAKALLARVYLYYTGYDGGKYDPQIVTKSEVLEGLESIISSNEYELIPEFMNLWPAASSTPIEGELAFNSTYAGDGNLETILAQKFNTTQDYDGNADANRWLVMMGMRNTNWSPYGKGWGAATVHPKVWASFEAKDARRLASIINIVGEGIESKFDKKDQREYTGYTVKKYTPMAFYDGTSASKADGSGDFQIAQHQDFVVMRYADVLLMAAELGSPNAQEYFDKVRSRAGLPSKALSNENIMQERFYEFAFEGQRYWDLLRQGFDVAANAISEEGYVVYSGGNADLIDIQKSNIISKKGLAQIPRTQIDYSNNVLKQNEGW